MSKGNVSKSLVWILMAMLIFGLGGFGVTNLGGSAQSIGSVGDKNLNIHEYARALQEELRALEAQAGRQIPFAEAQAAGLDRLVLARLVISRAMDAENTRMGVSIGDERLRSELMNISAFQRPDGSFDREAYAFALDQTGLNESDFEDSIREDSARGLLQAAIVSGVAMPESYATTLLNFLGEQRNVTLARIEADDLAYPAAAPSDADLRAFYDANIERFTRPATRDITYAWLTPAMLIDSVEVDQDALKALYEERDAEFNQPERRLVERLAFADEAAAQDALKRLNLGETTFEGLVAERGLELADTDMGDVSAAELGGAADVVFATGAGLIAGPAPSSLGPALFRVNGVLPARSTSFEDALPQLREELAAERGRRVIDAQINDIDDLLAAGATLEELAAETDMQLGSIGFHADIYGSIAGYESFRAIAQTVTESDFPQIENLEDGGVFALRLDGETPAAPAPFDEVKDAVAEAWKTQATVDRLQSMADGMLPALKGAADWSAFALTPRAEVDIIRNGFVADVPADFIAQVFDLNDGDVVAIPHDNSVLIVRLDAVQAPDMTNPEVIQLRNLILQQAASGLSNDVFEAYTLELQSIHEVQINQQAVNAVHTQFQ